MFETLAIKKGMVHLSSKIILNNVLFVPDLNCNLISIVKLIDDNIYEVTFTKMLCVMQDLIIKSPIEWMSLREGSIISRNMVVE